MQTQEEVRAELEALLPKLHENQRRFLELRGTVDTDGEAIEAIGMVRQSVSRWKKDAKFLQAWTLVTKVLKEPAQALIIPEPDRRALVVAQVSAMTASLPLLVAENVRIALYGIKETDRLRAIEKVYEMVGFGVDAGMPIGKQGRVFQRMLVLMGPQVLAEAGRRGIALPVVIDGDFEEVEEDATVLESELTDTP